MTTEEVIKNKIEKVWPEKKKEIIEIYNTLLSTKDEETLSQEIEKIRELLDLPRYKGISHLPNNDIEIIRNTYIKIVKELKTLEK